MIEPVLNELSFYPLCQSDDEVENRLVVFIDLIKELKNLGIRFVRYERSFADIMLKEHYSLEDYCFQAKDSKSKNRKDFFYSTFRRPYIDEDNESLLYENDSCKFVSNDCVEYDTLGLLVAHVTDSFAVGFDAGLFQGGSHKLCTLKLCKNNEVKNVHVCCLTQKDLIFSLKEFILLMASQPDLKVPISINKNRLINLPAHHGKDECEEFGKRLLDCDYVNEILNSIDFSPSEKNFIHKVGERNILEVRLPKSKHGYGLCISTSAENIIHNYWISYYLSARYGK